MLRSKTILLCAAAAVFTPTLTWSRATPPAARASSNRANSNSDSAGGQSDAAFASRMRSIAARLHPQHGDIRIPGANAVLHLGQNYYYLPPEEAKLVLTEAWSNPPGSVSDVLGLVLPEGKTFADDTWGAVITWEPSGYVSDDDADTADYDAILQQLRDTEPNANAQRRAAGYPSQHLVGWAQPPSYDRASHSVVWARNYQMEDVPENGLNYDIRLLGRRGVLSLNMVAAMSQLNETREAARRFAAAAEFESGARYADYDSGTDQTAAYGVGGLVAAGVGMAAASKLGLWAGILLFLKKGAIIIVAVLAGLWAGIRRLFGSRKREEADVYEGNRPDDAPPPQA